MINVSLSDSSARNIENRLHHCSGTVCEVWRVSGFSRTIAQLFPLSQDWHFSDGRQQATDNLEVTANATVDLSYEEMLVLLPCFVLISVGDALSGFVPFSAEHCK